MRRLGAGDAGRHGFSHRETACSSPQGRTHRVGYTTQKTKARVGEAKGTPNVPSGRRKSPAEAVLVQANVRQVPAHMRWFNLPECGQNVRTFDARHLALTGHSPRARIPSSHL